MRVFREKLNVYKRHATDMRNGFPFLMLWLVFAFSLSFYSASAQVAYRNYSPSDGLPSSQVYDILQDSHGYMWFATDRGVTRYDGYTFNTFTTRDGLQDNVVFKMAEDRHGGLWVASLHGGFCYYHNGVIKQHPANEEIKKIIAK